MATRSAAALFWSFAACGLASVAVLAVGCSSGRPANPAPAAAPTVAILPAVDVRDVNRALTATEAQAYGGDAACAPCHEAIFAVHSHSRHARTLRPVTVSEHGPYFAQGAAIRDPLLDVTYRVRAGKDMCVFQGETDDGPREMTADYVLGSGKNAHTYMSRVTDDMWIDLRLTYYTQIRKWDFTPMQKPGDRVFVYRAGVEQSGARLVDCLHCHATVLRASGTGVDAANSLVGVGCERCHGPARAHVDSARQAAAHPGSVRIAPLENLKRASQDRINNICGVCHRTPVNAPPGRAVTENGLARFEGAALARSACYQQSPSLSCVTCHDSHGDVDSSALRNDAKCLTCHSKSSVRPAGHPAKVCPVNPRSGCVSCHMPAQTIRTIPHATYHNHWIKVWPGSRAVAPGRR